MSDGLDQPRLGLNEEPEEAGEADEEIDAPPAGRAAKGGRW